MKKKPRDIAKEVYRNAWSTNTHYGKLWESQRDIYDKWKADMSWLDRVRLWIKINLIKLIGE